MSARPIAASGWSTAVTSMPSSAVISVAKASRRFFVGLKQRTDAILRTALAAISCAPACQPQPRMPTVVALLRARYLIPRPFAAPTRMRCITPSGRMASGSPFSDENNSTRPT